VRAVKIEDQVVLLGGEVLILLKGNLSASSIQSLLPDTVRLNKTCVILLPSGSKCMVYRNIPPDLETGSIGELVWKIMYASLVRGLKDQIGLAEYYCV
jgi:hypothetical protein